MTKQQKITKMGKSRLLSKSCIYSICAVDPPLVHSVAASALILDGVILRLMWALDTSKILPEFHSGEALQ